MMGFFFDKNGVKSSKEQEVSSKERRLFTPYRQLPITKFGIEKSEVRSQKSPIDNV